MGLSSDNKKLVIGLMNGDLVVRTKKDMSSASGSLGVESGSSLLNTEARSKQVRLYKVSQYSQRGQRYRISCSVISVTYIIYYPILLTLTRTYPQ